MLLHCSISQYSFACMHFFPYFFNYSARSWLVGINLPGFAVYMMNNTSDNRESWGKPEHTCSGSKIHIPKQNTTVLSINVVAIQCFQSLVIS